MIASEKAIDQSDKMVKDVNMIERSREKRYKQSFISDKKIGDKYLLKVDKTKYLD